jgi:hypothetical protein
LQDRSTDFEFLPIDVSLGRCQRYFEKSNGFSFFKIGTSLTNIPNNEIYAPIYYLVQKRAIPTVTITGFSGGNNQFSRVDTGADLGASSCIQYDGSATRLVTRNQNGSALTTVQGVGIANFFADAEL